MNQLTSNLPEIWGGVECTINRLGDRYLDQFLFAGLYQNPSYFNVLPDLGIKKIRFPILWEKHQPSQSTTIDWSWTEARLEELRSNNITPIAGLLHHGSGPSFTNLLEDDFPELFAAYAHKVAARFPWIQYYTPVNEPLTTARFSGLYGLWYPHKKNDVSFLNILLNELKASVLAMQQIRKINPDAKFVQTEDLGKTYSTPLLSYQANFENNRRWLTYDLLCGKFTQAHPLWEHAIRLGIKKEKLQFFTDNICPPDIIGVNHYITSERFLDENLEQYPADSAGGNDLHKYADVEAIRVQMVEPHGLAHLLSEMWNRYKIPIAITEAHLNCTREEQLRWFSHVYEIACKLKNEGVEMIAVTSWALFGSFGWNKLLTDDSGNYEAGAFDISAGYLRPTALALLLRSLSSQEVYNKNLLTPAGWWQLDSRYYTKSDNKITDARTNSKHPLIIIGKTGTLGKAFSKICLERNILHILLGREEADICNESVLISMISQYQPWAIINAAGYVNVDEAENNKDTCYKTNYLGAEMLAKICLLHNVRLVSFSSDLVFDGNKRHPYTEEDFSNPLNTYGQSKQLAELAISKNYPDTLMIRTAAFFSPWDEFNFVHQLLDTLKAGKNFTVSNDIFISPTYVAHLVHASLDLLIDNAVGTWHLANKDCLTWYQFAKKIISYTDLNHALVVPGYNMPARAKLPVFSALGSNKYNLMPSLDDALNDYFLTIRSKLKSTKTQNLSNETI